jgi:hypothetical protein
VTATTIHRAKGLEADFVHVAGLADFLLPSRFRDTLIDRVPKHREEDHLAEELRVLYVGMTRARAVLTLWVPCWSGRKQPSRFLPADNESPAPQDRRGDSKLVTIHGAARRLNQRGIPATQDRGARLDNAREWDRCSAPERHVVVPQHHGCASRLGTSAGPFPCTRPMPVLLPARGARPRSSGLSSPRSANPFPPHERRGGDSYSP